MTHNLLLTRRNRLPTPRPLVQQVYTLARRIVLTTPEARCDSSHERGQRRGRRCRNGQIDLGAGYGVADIVRWVFPVGLESLGVDGQARDTQGRNSMRREQV